MDVLVNSYMKGVRGYFVPQGEKFMDDNGEELLRQSKDTPPKNSSS